MKLGILKKGLDKLNSLAPAINVFSNIMDANTLAGLRQGKVFLTDEIINAEIAKRISEKPEAQLSEVTINSHADGKLSIVAKTKANVSVTLTGTIDNFSYNDGEATVVYRVDEHQMHGTLITSWLFSTLSFGLMQRFFDIDKMPENIDVAIDGDNITVDLSRLIAASRLGQAEVKGIKPINMLEIKSATPKHGGIEIEARLKIADTAKTSLKALLDNK